MSDMLMDEKWLEIIKQQEVDLTFEMFDRDDAFRIGVSIINLAKQKYNDEIAVSIIEDRWQE